MLSKTAGVWRGDDVVRVLPVWADGRDWDAFLCVRCKVLQQWPTEALLQRPAASTRPKVGSFCH